MRPVLFQETESPLQCLPPKVGKRSVGSTQALQTKSGKTAQLPTSAGTSRLVSRLLRTTGHAREGGGKGPSGQKTTASLSAQKVPRRLKESSESGQGKSSWTSTGNARPQKRCRVHCSVSQEGFVPREFHLRTTPRRNRGACLCQLPIPVATRQGSPEVDFVTQAVACRLTKTDCGCNIVLFMGSKNTRGEGVTITRRHGL